MKWILAAPYIHKLEKSLWTVAMDEDKSLELILSPSFYEHNRSRPQSSLNDWKDYWQHSRNAWQQAQDNNCGIITAFPQLPVCAGIRKKFSRQLTPIVAWTFNLGSLHDGHKRKLARFALQTVDKFIVHSSAEINNYSAYLNLPSDRFEFVPLHKPLMPITVSENKENPFILAMGSANRDYKTLFKAIKKCGYPLTIVAPKHSLNGLEIPATVTIKSNLSLSECRLLVQQARINIIPIDNEFTASGQVTVIEAMMYKKPVIATNTIGTRDYIIHKKTGLLTSSKSVLELQEAIDALWNDETLRNSISSEAHSYVAEKLNHKKTAERLIQILNSI